MNVDAGLTTETATDIAEVTMGSDDEKKNLSINEKECCENCTKYEMQYKEMSKLSPSLVFSPDEYLC